ncbi:Short-chain dehydrogenase TIC 32 B, chloroplastic, partial [Cucurbita argyrosperma subsp. sororia]
MFCPFQLSEDGIEMQFGTNHLGHFLLTNLLLEKMKNTAKSTGIEGRIVNLSSIAHVHTYGHGIRFNKINEKKGYSDKRAYGQSKLANILHIKELTRRFQEEGVNITANAVHPGLIMTPLMRHSKLLMRLLRVFTFFIWKNVPQGASTTCYVALHQNLKGVSGKYFLDNNEKRPSSYARDEALAKKLWNFSEDLISSISKV